MIFLGDIACPDFVALDVEKLQKIFKGKPLVANLEGPIVKNKSLDNLKNKVLFNNEKIIDQLKELNVQMLSLANNHIMDLDFAGLKHTLNILEQKNIKNVGAGESLKEASKPASFEDDESYIFLGFGWEVIQCKIAGKNRAGVNPFEPLHILKSIKRVKAFYPDSCLILLFHWNYELELYPQPLERQLARLCIDNGAGAIMGCHSHLVQGIEMYKDCPIVYGLGNGFLPQFTFHSGKLQFPVESYNQMAVEWKPSQEPICHWFVYNPKNHRLKHKESETLSKSSRMKELTPYKSLDSQEYKEWFKKNRKKKLLLPIFKDIEQTTPNFFKSRWVIIRGWIIDILLFLKIKKIRSGLK